MARILVLDDEPLISMMLDEWLSELGCETIGPAHSVQSALVLLENETPDAGILDVSLGDDNSYAVAMALRARGIPFALATGYGDKCVETSFKDEIFIPKPFDFEAIKNVLRQLLRSSHSHRAGSHNR